MTPITHRNREIERLEHELAESREECRRMREALKPFALQMKWFEALANAQGHYKPTHLDDKSLSSFQHTSLTLFASPMNTLKVKNFRQALEALAPKVEDK